MYITIAILGSVRNAAAVKAGAQVIATSNLKDFSDLPEGVEAQSPDAFLCNLFDLVASSARSPQRAWPGLTDKTNDSRPLVVVEPPLGPQACDFDQQLVTHLGNFSDEQHALAVVPKRKAEHGLCLVADLHSLIRNEKKALFLIALAGANLTARFDESKPVAVERV